jgi:hypothetical protein
LKRRSTPSSALIPYSGYAAAWDARPWNVKCSFASARNPFATWRREDGWTIIAASIPRKAPFSTIRALPYPISSAGVPRAITFPARKTPAPNSASAAAAHADATPTMLCPQACPSPGSASISHRNATAGRPFPKANSARKAVSIPATPRFTRNPRASRNAERASEVRVSFKGSSAYDVIPRSMRTAPGPSPFAIDRTFLFAGSMGARAFLRNRTA